MVYKTKIHIKAMKHTIGFNRNRVKNNKYKYYRNYYCSGSEKMKEFEDLINEGMAIKDIRDSCIYYFLTDKGISYLSELIEVDIIEL